MIWVFRAKVIHIESPHQVDLNIDLGFDVHYRRKVKLNGYPVTDVQYKDAKSCLVVLIGGNRVYVKMDREDDIWVARMYLYYPVKIDGTYEVLQDRRLPCVNRVMLKMAELNFDPEKLKSYIDKVTQPEDN